LSASTSIATGKAKSPLPSATSWASTCCLTQSDRPTKAQSGGSTDAAQYPNLEPILTRAINWELIRQQYDEIIKYTTALKLGTAEPKPSCGALPVRVRRIRPIRH
jgi:hypothetical protein